MAESQTTSETTEEDATELQFPKGVAGRGEAEVASRFKTVCETGVVREEATELTHIGDLKRLDSLASLRVKCDHCGVRVRGAYIRCSECTGVGICVQCFSRGVEFKGHRSDHGYWIEQAEESVVEAGWSSVEEVDLLDALSVCGLGDWEEISRCLPGRTPDQCRAHYTRCYLNPRLPALATALNTPVPLPTALPDPVEYQAGGDDPPRPMPGSTYARELAGYNPARGDFETEADGNAEAAISDLDPTLFDSDPPGGLGVALQDAVLDVYRRCLGHRHRRKRIMKDHGLIATTKTGAMLSRYRHQLPHGFLDVLPRILPLLSALDLDLLIEGLRYESELKRQITDLIEWRSAGLTRHRSVLTFESLRRRRETVRKERRNLVVAHGGLSQDQWSVLPRFLTQPGTATTSNRRVSAPLNICGKPGYSALNESERQLCSELRLLPEDFIRFKTYFIEECRRSGGLKLAQARSLIKIDVNKTRKIYDHLLDQGLIYTPSKK